VVSAAGHEVAGVAAGGDELLALVGRERACGRTADVAILDIQMPPGDQGGLVTARRLRERHPDVGLLLLSNYAESHYLTQFLAIGTESVGYRLKGRISGVDVLTDTLMRIGAGELVIEPVLARALVDRPDPRKSALSGLSGRELDVLRLMAEGRSNGGIAAELYLSAKAIEKHIANIFTKLDLPDGSAVHHRRVLAVLAYLEGAAGAPGEPHLAGDARTGWG
jgi:DNA-binding NarL/FixJ family response regulator